MCLRESRGVLRLPHVQSQLLSSDEKDGRSYRESDYTQILVHDISEWIKNVKYFHTKKHTSIDNLKQKDSPLLTTSEGNSVERDRGGDTSNRTTPFPKCQLSIQYWETFNLYTSCN